MCRWLVQALQEASTIPCRPSSHLLPRSLFALMRACIYFTYLLTLLDTRHPSSTWLPGPYCSDFATPDNHFIFSQSHNKRELDLHCKIAPLALRASTVSCHFNPASPSRQHLRLRSHLPPALSTTTCASTTTTEQYCSSKSWGNHSLAGGHYGRSLCLYVH